MKATTAALIAPYRTFLRLPDVPAMIACAWLSRMPIGMNGLSMLLFLRETLGNFKLAGTIGGAFFVSMAVAAPVMGRTIDRIGPRWPLMISGIVHPICLIALFVAALNGASYGALIAIAIFAGLFTPPVTILTRTTWRHRFSDEQARKMAYTIDSVMIEINFTFGPLLVATIAATWGARMAMIVMIAISIAAVAIFIASPILKYWKTEPPVERHMLGPLTDLRLVALFGLTFGLTFGFGLMEVGYPAYATSLGLVAFGGVLMAINSLGSAVGGFVYGALHLKAPLERQFSVALVLMGLPLFVHGLVDQNVLFALIAFTAGLAIAPALTAQTLLVTRIAPARYATEAFTWSSTFIVTGLGIGMAAGGTLSETVHPKSPFIVAGAVVTLMSLLSLMMPRSDDQNAKH
ncbi:MAG: MFS transporter [Betaproteobacteria bacterium]|nr:MFS transporter [Betaproteobacteria bacterium]